MKPSYQLANYTFFVVHITALICIAAIYLYAYRFLGERFFIPLSIGWLINAGYLALETYLLMIRGVAPGGARLGLLTAAVGLLSFPFFHSAVQSTPKTRPKPWYRPFILGAVPILACLVGAVAIGSLQRYPERWLFVMFTIPAVIYSATVLMTVAHRFFVLFPEDDYGNSSTFLYVSWALYGILQFFYPFKLFAGIDDLFLALFIFAFGLKVVSSIALLSVLRESYLEASAEIHDSSVLADLGNLAAGLHHDIATPIGHIDSEIELLSQKRHGDVIVEKSLDNIRKPLGLIHSAIRFVDLMRQDPAKAEQAFRRTNAKEPVEFAMGLFKKRYATSGLRIVPPAKQSNYYIRANKEILAEAFLNILKNALEASAKVVRIIIRRSRIREGSIDFLFQNDGRPISEEEKKLAFKAGWSTKQDTVGRANVGMGLYMASRIVGMHGGKIKIDNDRDSKGVTVIVTLAARKKLPGALE